jgi:ABC-type uncharacterized transport system auxiliary subunit
MMKRLIFVSAMAATLAGCATQGKYKAKLDTWIGSPIDSLVASWGYPSGQITAPNGNTVYVYERHGGFVMPTTTTTNARVTGYGNTAYGQATTTSYGGQYIDMSCRTFFEVAPDRRIVSWRYEGNACKST